MKWMYIMEINGWMIGWIERLAPYTYLRHYVYTHVVVPSFLYFSLLPSSSFRRYMETVLNPEKPWHTYIDCIPLEDEGASEAPMFFKQALAESDVQVRKEARRKVAGCPTYCLDRTCLWVVCVCVCVCGMLCTVLCARCSSPFVCIHFASSSSYLLPLSLLQ